MIVIDSELVTSQLLSDFIRQFRDVLRELRKVRNLSVTFLIFSNDDF